MKFAMTLIAALALLFAACGSPQSESTSSGSSADGAELTSMTLAVSGMT